MTMMQPDPSAEFREEKEFRAKVYRMLALGLSTTEVEGLIQKKVDWSLFSEETLRDMVESSQVSIVSMPPELVDALRDVLKSSTEVSKENLEEVSKAFTNLSLLHESTMQNVKKHYLIMAITIFVLWSLSLIMIWSVLS